jgi:hypothetical protein
MVKDNTPENFDGGPDIDALIGYQFDNGLLTEEQVKLLADLSPASVGSYLGMNLERHNMTALLSDRGVISSGERSDFEEMDPFDAMKELLTIKHNFDRESFITDSKSKRGIDDYIA